MATVVCQGLHSSLVDSPQKVEPPLVPPPPVMLRLNLSSPKPADLGGWSFLQYSLSSTDNSPREQATATARKDAYAPPQARGSSLKLSDRSLQLCTENLGSETGTEVSEGDSILCNVRNSESPRKSPTAMTRQRSEGRKVNPPREIPPPLTTLRGAETLQVRVHREDGRLVIDGVKSPSMSTRFQAERVDGRLRLSILRADFPVTDVPESDKLQVSEPAGEDQNQPARIDTEFSRRPIDKGNRNGTVEDEHSEKNKESLSFGGEDPQDLQGGENATGKLIQRPIIRIRCNEGEHDHHHHHHHHHHHQNKILHNWEPLWVATS